MVLVSLFEPRLLPDPPDSIFWGVKCIVHCDNIIVNPSLYMKVSFIIDLTESVELAIRDVLVILW